MAQTKESTRLYPCAVHLIDQTYLYLIGFDDGRIKVGQTRNPRERIRHHINTGRGSVAWTHLFGQPDSGHAEGDAKRALGAIGTRLGVTEVFSGLTRESALAAIRPLIWKAIARHEESRKRAAAFAPEYHAALRARARRAPEERAESATADAQE